MDFKTTVVSAERDKHQENYEDNGSIFLLCYSSKEDVFWQYQWENHKHKTKKDSTPTNVELGSNILPPNSTFYIQNNGCKRIGIISFKARKNSLC